MSRSVTSNIVANAISRLWMGGLQFAFTPVYAALLGPEAYGLVGFYNMLLLTTLFLDQCVSPVIVREFGRLTGKSDSAAEMRELLRSLEGLSLITGIVVGGGIALAAPLIARHWLSADSLSESSVVLAVRLMGLVMACQWTRNLYAGGFVGLHRQDLLTRLQLLLMTVQWGGAALLLWLAAPRIELLLLWQAGTFLLLTLLLRRRLLLLLPVTSVAVRFRMARLAAVWRFAAGTLVIGLTGSLLTQVDKIVVSTHVPLDRFAGYSLAFTMAALISILVAQPVGSAVMPLFSRLLGQGDDTALAREYHQWTQILCTLALPLTGALVVFGRPIVSLWLGTGSPLVGDVAWLLRWVALGFLLNAVMTVPFLLQIAAGWTRLSVGKNIVALFLVLPVLLLGLPHYGMLVGALVWFALNLGYYCLEVPLMHRWLLPGELWRWWGQDTLLPGAVAAALFAASGWLAPAGGTDIVLTLQAALTSIAVFMVLLALLPYPRAAMRSVWRRFAPA